MQKLILLSTICVLLGQASWADTITLANGGIMLGEIESIAAGIIKIKRQSQRTSLLRQNLNNANVDIVEVGLWKSKETIQGKVDFLDDYTLEITTDSGRRSIPRWKVRKINLYM